MRFPARHELTIAAHLAASSQCIGVLVHPISQRTSLFREDPNAVDAPAGFIRMHTAEFANTVQGTSNSLSSSGKIVSASRRLAELELLKELQHETSFVERLPHGPNRRP